MKTKTDDKLFQLVQTARGPRRIFTGSSEDLIHNWTAEGIAQIDAEITKREAAEAKASTGKASS